MAKTSKLALSAAGVAILLLLAVASWFYWADGRVVVPPSAHESLSSSAPPAFTAAPAPASTPDAADAQAQTPSAFSEPDTTAATVAPLPSLADSDIPMRAALADVFGAPPVEAFLIPDHVIRRLVVTVNSLDGEPIALKQRATIHVGEPLVVAVDQQGQTVLSADNAERYDAFVSALDAVDVGALARLYRRYAPLFDRAYQEQGYPQAQFLPRLLDVLDHLSGFAVPAEPIVLARPKVLYTFADVRLERLSWGRKILIRVGDAHARTIQRKLAALAEALRAADAAASSRP